MGWRKEVTQQMGDMPVARSKCGSRSPPAPSHPAKRVSSVGPGVKPGTGTAREAQVPPPPHGAVWGRAWVGLCCRRCPATPGEGFLPAAEGWPGSEKASSGSVTCVESQKESGVNLPEWAGKGGPGREDGPGRGREEAELKSPVFGGAVPGSPPQTTWGFPSGALSSCCVSSSSLCLCLLLSLPPPSFPHRSGGSRGRRSLQDSPASLVGQLRHLSFGR